MNPRRFVCRFALALIDIPARAADAIAARIDAYRWTAVTVPMVAVADFIERLRIRLEQAEATHDD